MDKALYGNFSSTPYKMYCHIAYKITMLICYPNKAKSTLSFGGSVHLFRCLAQCAFQTVWRGSVTPRWGGRAQPRTWEGGSSPGHLHLFVFCALWRIANCFLGNLLHYHPDSGSATCMRSLSLVIQLTKQGENYFVS